MNRCNSFEDILSLIYNISIERGRKTDISCIIWTNRNIGILKIAKFIVHRLINLQILFLYFYKIIHMEKKQYRKRYHQHKTIANTVNTSTTSHKFFFKQFSTYASKEIHMGDKVKRFKVPFAYAAHVSVAHSFLTTKANANIQYTLMYPPC